MSFPRHLLSKESGLAWLGQIPDHWGVGQSRRLFAVRNEGAHATDKQLTASQEYGVIYQEDFVQREGRRVVQVILGADILKHVEPGDFVISMRSFQGGIEFCPLRGCISSAYVMLSPVQPVHRPFFKYLFKSKPYIQALQLTSNLVRDGQALRFDNFAQVSLPLVPLAEQVAIAAILDRETAKIDDLVKEQQRLIELLKEKRQAAISQAVTKGLNPNVPMKDSGVEWLGKVPAHWTVCALRRVIAAIEQGWSPECESAPADDLSWGVLKAGCVNRGVFDPSENKALPDELAPIAEYEVSSGDVLVSRASGSPELVGSTALVGETRGKLMLSDKIFRVHLVPRMTSPFFVWAMNGRALRDQIERALSGGNGLANNLPQSAMLAFLVAVPPVDEQRIISKVIEDAVGRCDALIAEANRAVDLLVERRAALIAAAVTGKIDARGLVSKPEAVAA